MTRRPLRGFFNGSHRRALVAGWFSLRNGGGATVGDVQARDVVGGWLEEAGVPFDFAVSPPLAAGVDWQDVDPRRYSHLVLVCGPVWDGCPLTPLLDRFKRSRRVGVNLSMVTPSVRPSTFDALIARDGPGSARVDVSLARVSLLPPVVGVLRVHHQREYAERALHAQAEAVLDRFVSSADVAVVPIDTVLRKHDGRMPKEAEIEAVIARMDAVLTMRLHGLVLALKHGVPAVAIDPVAGGAKIASQARTLGWPYVHVADTLDESVLAESLRHCLEPEARQLARASAEVGRELVEGIKAEFRLALD